jgi:hypothetical protein
VGLVYRRSSKLGRSRTEESSREARVKRKGMERRRIKRQKSAESCLENEVDVAGAREAKRVKKEKEKVC